MPMDIRAWLAETVDREPPGEQDEHPYSFAQVFKPQQRAQAKPTVRRGVQYKRRRISSNEAPPTAHRHRREPSTPYSTSSQSRRTESASTSSTSSITCTSQRRLPIRDQSVRQLETFERQRRRRTRPEIYGWKSKEHTRSRRKLRDKSNRYCSKRKKGQKSGDGAHTAGLVQRFELQSGSKGNRLTLRPDVNSGIFKHGRCSMRRDDRQGLPDLVFNEMKFLQRPNEHQDTMTKDQPGSRPVKRSKKQLQEEEISTYFAKKPAETQANHPRDERPTTSRGQEDELHDQRPANGMSRRQKPADLPNEQFLGFGSRGPSHERSGGKNARNSCYTWSESTPIRTASQPPKSHNCLSVAPVSDSVCNTPELRRGRGLHDKPERAPQTRPEPKGFHKEQRGMLKSSAKQLRAVHSRTSSCRQSSRFKLPSLSPSNNRGVVEHADSKSFHTSDVLKFRNDAPCLEKSVSCGDLSQVEDMGAGKENLPPITSTPESQALRNTFRSVIENQSVLDPLAGFDNQVRQYDYPMLKTAIQTANESLDLAAGKHCWENDIAQIPERDFSRTNAHAHLPCHRVARVARPAQSIVQTAGHESTAAVQHSMLDNINTARLQTLQTPFQHRAASHQIKGLIQHMASEQEPPSFNPETNHVNGQTRDRLYRADGMADAQEQGLFFAESDYLADSLTELPLYDEGLQEAGHRVQQECEEAREAREAMMKFWRPNVLY